MANGNKMYMVVEYYDNGEYYDGNYSSDATIMVAETKDEAREFIETIPMSEVMDYDGNKNPWKEVEEPYGIRDFERLARVDIDGEEIYEYVSYKIEPVDVYRREAKNV